jgi:hypothetical protein
MQYQISTNVKRIVSTINSDKVNSLDYATINYYKIRIIDELDRLFKVLPTVPEVVQKEITEKLVRQLEGSIDVLNSLNPPQSNVDTLLTIKL